MMLLGRVSQGMIIMPTMTHPPSTAAAAKAAEEEEEEGGQHQQPDTLLVRSSFVGDLFTQPCFLFAPLPIAHAAKVRQKQAKPQRILTPADLAKTSQSQHDRQGRGQQQRADAPAERQKLGHVTAMHIQPDETPSSSQGEAIKGQLRKAKGASKGTSNEAERQHAAAQRAAMGNKPPAKGDSSNVVDAPQQAPPDDVAELPHAVAEPPAAEAQPGSMLRHIDMRQSIKSRAEIR